MLTNPSLVLKAAQLPQYQALIADAIGKARRRGGSEQTQLINARDQVAVDISSEVLRHVPGRISTEVDARYARDRGMCVAQARKLIQMYEKNGIGGAERIRLSWRRLGRIRAAEELEKSGINCNLTLLFPLPSTRLRRSGVYLISPFVGRIYDWYQKHQPQETISGRPRPGVVSVRQIISTTIPRLRDTLVMGASFRRIEQIQVSGGLRPVDDFPALLDELAATQAAISRRSSQLRQRNPTVADERC